MRFQSHRTSAAFVCFFLSSSACATSLREASSGATGCNPGDVRIEEEGGSLFTRTWMASCEARTYRCSAGMREVFPFLWEPIGTACTQVGGYASAPRPAAVRKPPPVVARRDAQKRMTLASSFRLSKFDFVLYAVPELTADRIALYIESPTEVTPSCDVAFMMDGEILTGDSYRTKFEKPRIIKVVLSKQALKDMASATRLSGRICSETWRLDDSARKVLTEFTARFHEEVTWQARR